MSLTAPPAARLTTVPMPVLRAPRPETLRALGELRGELDAYRYALEDLAVSAGRLSVRLEALRTALYQEERP